MGKKGKGRGKGRGSSSSQIVPEDQHEVRTPIGLQRPEPTNAPELQRPEPTMASGLQRPEPTTASGLQRPELTKASVCATPNGFGRGRGRGNINSSHPAVQFGQLQQLGPPTCPLPQQFEDCVQPSTSAGTVEHGIYHRLKNLKMESLVPKATSEQSTGKIVTIPARSTNIDTSKFAVRPGRGTQGRPISLFANYFIMQHEKTNIYHYDVEINSLDQKSKFHQTTSAEAKKAGLTHLQHELNKNVGKVKCQEVIEQLVKSKSLQDYNPVYDGGKNIYTNTPLPITSKQSFVVTVNMMGRPRNYEVVIQPVEKDNGSNMICLDPLKDMRAGVADTDNVPQEILMALNTIMNHRGINSTQIQVGRSFFFLNQTENVPLGEGIEIWFGYNQSVHFTERGPALILNLSAKAVHKSGPVIDYANDVLRTDITRLREMSPFQVSKLSSALKGLKVEVTHLPYPRKYPVQGVSRSSANDLRLDIDGVKITVARYFNEKYKNLRYPNLPCLHMRSNNNQTYVPLENCNVCAGQPKLGKINPMATRKMIKETAVPAQMRFSNIASYAETVRKESGSQMRNFKILMDFQPMKLQGRILDPPLLAYFDEIRNIIQPDMKGTWRMDGKHFFRTVKPTSWILLSFVDERRMCSRKCLEDFSKLLSNTGKRLGLDFGKLLEIKIFSYDKPMWDALMYAKESKASFAVAVLSKKEDNHSYEELKFIGDYHLNMVTQCMDEMVINRFNEQIASNVCLKINAKLGGVNHVLRERPAIFTKPVIIFGADAVHSPRGSGCPSIAAVVGSLDAYPSRYKLTCRVQDNPDGSKISQERILELQAMVESILTAFYHTTKGKYPERIMFYRDGVSEGQFGTILENEVTNIQKACLKVIGSVIPITFIIVQKRHQTRFRPQDPRQGIGKMGNVPPGTTVDTDVTHPRYFDFFLCSHEGIQGTSKPAKYTVLHDDNNFTADEIQKLSFHLCHMYVRCNRSISIPAPVMYADLAAYRAKKYADWHIQRSPENSSNSSDCSSKLPEHVREAINKMESFQTNMFFV